jgi:CRISPR-associated protein Csm1
VPWEWEESVLLKKGDLKQMNENMFKIVLGCLLHDLGKIPGSQLNDEDHCKRGYDLLQKVGITDKDLLDQVLYHHNTDPFYHSNNESSLVYITETANDIVNRKTKLQQENQNQGDSSIRPLESIFNILNGNRQKYFYSVKTYTKERDINYPVPDSPTVDQKAYDDIAKNMEKCLLNVSFTRDFVHLLLDTLHNNLSYVSSLQGEGEIADISLYDHLKMTACIGVCILRYLESLGCRDYKTRLKTNKETFYSEKAFLLFEMDVSGIQDFIYTVSSERALKTLRARSFYLEIMVEHLIDELLESIGLTRVNLMYSGGGHAYLLLPNTRDVIEKIERFEKETNRWFLKTYKTSLYVACGYSLCQLLLLEYHS